MSLVENIVRNFERIQFGLIGLVAGAVFFYLMKRRPASKFRMREADRKDLGRSKPGQGRAQPPPPLSLPGIRLNGEPHEILGIRADAGESEILRAYKEAIKRFHPDTIQGPAKEQLEFYQQASAAINNAKNQMIKNLRDR